MNNFDPIGFQQDVANGGLLGVILIVAIWALGFIASAFFTALWVRLILFFMRRTLDNEYARMRHSGFTNRMGG